MCTTWEHGGPTDLDNLLPLCVTSVQSRVANAKEFPKIWCFSPGLSYPIYQNGCMDIGPANQVISDLHNMEFGTFDKHATIEFLGQLQRWRGMFDALEITAARRLHELSVTAPADLAAATRRPARVGHNVFERAATVARIDAVARPLRNGALDGSHVDTLTKVMRTVGEQHLEAFTASLPAIIEHAAASGATPDDLARTLHRAARALENDDGQSRFEQQRRDTALRTWTDKRNGMFRISGQFDPKSGALLNGRLQGVVSALFAERTPSTCPTDAGRKQDHLRALALLALTLSGGAGERSEGGGTKCDRSTADPPGENRNADPSTHTTSHHDDGGDTSIDEWADLYTGGPSRFGRPEIVIVLDARQQTVEANDGEMVVDWGIPVELPPKALAEMFPRADIRPVIIANGVVVHAPGEMNLGRTTRLASRAQRRALRAMYPTCAIPGCGVAFAHTKPHHVQYWEHGGPTDLDNLLPLCSKHHHGAHEGGWRLTLKPDRTLTIIHPDKSIHTTGPPLRLRAA